MTGIEGAIETVMADLPFESWERLTGESSAAFAASFQEPQWEPDRRRLFLFFRLASLLVKDNIRFLRPARFQ
jgi:hypothetical protein